MFIINRQRLKYKEIKEQSADCLETNCIKVIDQGLITK